MSKKFKDKTLSSLPEGSVIGTSSLRRTAQLARNMPHLKVQNIRGNLNTRLRKLDDANSCYAAIILATAGVKRMGWDDRISQILEPEEALYAVGQGALGVECRESDKKIRCLLESLFDVETTLRCVCERSFLKTLGGGCSAPVAVSSSLNNKELTITGAVWSLDGKTLIKSTSKKELYLPDDDGEPPRKCPYQEPRLYCSVVPVRTVSSLSLLGAETLGKDLAKSLIKKNALDVMSQARNEILDSK
ncbi:Porphobilinogen deaminase [Ooceraea biroi]|nr:Porphobilinogen deaminase [Ooceraea biroi]